MRWKFWIRNETQKDETVIEVKNITSTTTDYIDKTIYVKAQTNEKALELFEKLKKKETKA